MTAPLIRITHCKELELLEIIDMYLLVHTDDIQELAKMILLSQILYKERQ